MMWRGPDVCTLAGPNHSLNRTPRRRAHAPSARCRLARFVRLRITRKGRLMTNVLTRLTIALVFTGVSAAEAITCAQFTTLGPNALTADQLIMNPATKEQVAAFKAVIAPHAGDLAGFTWSARARAFKLVQKTNSLAMVMRESLAVTRVFCYDRPTDSFDAVAVDQFDYMLDTIAKRNGL